MGHKSILRHLNYRDVVRSQGHTQENVNRRHAMNLSVKERIAVGGCICWLLWCYAFLKHIAMASPLNEDFLVVGVIPVVIILGIMWIRRCRKKFDGPK